MEEWKTYKLGEISTMKYGKLPPPDISKGRYPVHTGYRIVGFADSYNTQAESVVVIARGVGGCGDVKIMNNDCYLTNLSISIVLDKKMCLPAFFYYFHLLSNLAFLNSGSAQPQITIDSLQKYEFAAPSINKQQKIVSILKSLDDKIECNRKINENLEQQAQALFKSWFVDFEPFKDGKFVESELGMIPEGWRVASLTDIANYTNGLAMQKFRPEEGEIGIPVLKIKELGQGSCDNNSDLCTPNLKEDYIVNDGDVIFSWSGTLLVDLWCGGKCGLNQHLFKVTSDCYPKWFYYLWTLHHLDKFIHIAKDKAVTMGHIKRGELDKSLVCFPTNLEKANSLFEPIITMIISNRIENRKLASLRDTLLPKLMSGELKVNEIKI